MLFQNSSDDLEQSRTNVAIPGRAVGVAEPRLQAGGLVQADADSIRSTGGILLQEVRRLCGSLHSTGIGAGQKNFRKQEDARFRPNFNSHKLTL